MFCPSVSDLQARPPLEHHAVTNKSRMSVPRRRKPVRSRFISPPPQPLQGLDKLNPPSPKPARAAEKNVTVEKKNQVQHERQYKMPSPIRQMEIENQKVKRVNKPLPKVYSQMEQKGMNLEASAKTLLQTKSQAIHEPNIRLTEVSESNQQSLRDDLLSQTDAG